MIISGIRKLTLLDYPGRTACTIFTGGCNFRCPFCHNSPLVVHLSQEENLDTAEIMGFLSKRAGLLDGVCITGGEPLLQSGLEDFVREVKKLGYSVKLDTNGCFPDELSSLFEKGLIDYVAMDIKSDEAGYPRACGIGEEAARAVMPKIKKSIATIIALAPDYEFRTTLVGGIHDAGSVAGACELIKGAKKYFLQSYVDSGAVISPEGLYSFSKQELLGLLAVAKNVLPSAELRGVD